MNKYQNVYADISVAIYLFSDKKNIKKTRDASGFAQVLFATDYPGPLY